MGEKRSAVACSYRLQMPKVSGKDLFHVNADLLSFRNSEFAA